MIYVSLTTIPQRIKSIKKSIDSLINQTQKPDKIFINVPTKYKRFEEIVEEDQIPNFNDSRIEVTRIEAT